MNDNKTNQYTQNYMLKFDQAISLVWDNCNAVDSEIIQASESLGRVIAKALHAPAAIPAFDNSAMDGYAVNAKDLLAASPENPQKLQLAGLTAAGDPTIERDQGQTLDTTNKAWKIMTGAPVPSGFDSILPVENTQLVGDQVSCFSPVVSGDHIRRRGEDFNRAEPIADVGDIINANSIMALAALGIGEVEVYKKIDVAIFSTGKELVEDPTQVLKSGQIRNSNKPYIINWFNGLPANVIDAGTNYDEVELFEKDLQAQLDKGTKIIISSGAVSMGDFDFIPQAIKKLGGKIIFHKSKIRPGKPILFAKFNNGSLYFGLPGNPISAAIGLRFFVAAAFRKMQGVEPEKAIAAIASNSVDKKQGFRAILKTFAEIDQQAKLQLTILEGQQSFKIKPLLSASGWAVIDEDKASLQPGELLEYYPTLMQW